MLDLSQIIETEFPGFSATKNTTVQGETFLKWFFKNIESEVISNDEIDECLVGKKSDCGIDAYYYDEESKILRLYQGKFKSVGGDLTDIEKADGIDMIEKLSSKISKERWANARKDRLDNTLFSYLTDNSIKIIFIYATSCNQFKMNEYYDKLTEVTNDSEIIIDIIVYSEAEILRKINNEIKPLIANFISQKGKYNKFDYETSDGKYKAYIMNIVDNDLIKLSKQEYFNENIRFGLGNSKINKNITDTANKEPEMFWFFNNGITIICSEVVENGHSFTLKKAQVVNGAQTIHSLKKASKDKINSVSVLAKILEIGESNEILDSMVRYTNSQNKIDGWQFYSNKPFWKVLREYFLEKGVGYIDLIYKAGIKLPENYANLVVSNKIKLTEFILVFIAYSGSPQLSKKGQSAIFKEDRFGKNIFDSFFSEDLLSIKSKENIVEKELKEFYLVLKIFVQMEKENILKNVADELLSGNERKQAHKGIETVLKHSRYYLLYILKNKLDELEESNRNLYLQDILENRLRDFVKICAENIFLEVWKKVVMDDHSLISNAPRFLKNDKFKIEIDKRLKNIDIQSFIKTL